MVRLQTRPQFQAVLAGSTVARTQHFALHALQAHPEPEHGVNVPPLFVPGSVSLGAMVPKRWARRAVTRNAIKRQIYNVSMEFESSLNASAYVVRLRSAFDRSHFVSATSDALKLAVRSELHQLFAPRAGA